MQVGLPTINLTSSYQQSEALILPFQGKLQDDDFMRLKVEISSWKADSLSEEAPKVV